MDDRTVLIVGAKYARHNDEVLYSVPEHLHAFLTAIQHERFIFNCSEAQEVMCFSDILQETRFFADVSTNRILVVFVENFSVSELALEANNLVSSLNSLTPETSKGWPPSIVDNALELLGPDWRSNPDRANFRFDNVKYKGRYIILKGYVHTVSSYPIDFL